MGIYVQGDLSVETKITIESIEELALEVKPGEHGKLILKGNIKEEDGHSTVFTSWENTEIKLYGKGELLFYGLVRQINLTHEVGLFTTLLEAVSATVKLDVEKKSRSFQDIGMTYKEAFLQVLTNTPGSRLRFYGSDVPLGTPAYQLEETDWQWIKRMASWLGEPIFAGISTNEPRMEVGLSERSYYEPDEEGVTEIKTGKTRGQLYRVVRTGENWNPGERVRWRGKEYVIGEKSGRLEKGLLWFSYTLGRKEAFHVTPYSHPGFRGRRLAATVMERKKELVRVRFAIDKEQQKDKAYWYPWCPVSGNLFYCMPEEGEQIYIELEDSGGRKARAVEGIRQNGKGNPELLPQNRLFTTRESKRLTLAEEKIAFQDFGQKEPLQMLLDDLFGVEVRSNEKLTIWAKGDIGVKGETLSFQAPKEISLLRKDALSPTVINLCNGFDSIGQTNQVVAGKEGREAFPQFGERSSCSGQKEEYELPGLEQSIIASTPAVRMSQSVERKICGFKVEGIGNE